MIEETFTLKHLAKAVYPAGSDREQDQFMRQVRHWTACDLLRPVGGKNTGTGVSRRYTASDIRRAAILAELHRYRVPVPVVENFAEAMDTYEFGRGFDVMWKSAIAGDRPVFLQLAWTEGFTSWGIDFDEPNSLMVAPEGKSRDPGDPFHITSAIVINLTSVFARIEL
jgi:hypothetical protein